VLLTRVLRAKIEELNPGLPATAYEDAVRRILTVSASQTLATTNREKCDRIKDGVQVTFRNAKGERVRDRVRVFDFDHPESNHFLCVRELWVRGNL
jgi:type I restriction enzyme, R subunit